eukprot:GHVP01007448.1.p1 GENE.GHVP01007448.1~~GHVP01007448.1.p1  ORF type:complete len:121 (+),score=15.24 GHVP01007448.1:125-487(+)
MGYCKENGLGDETLKASHKRHLHWGNFLSAPKIKWLVYQNITQKGNACSWVKLLRLRALRSTVQLLYFGQDEIMVPRIMDNEVDFEKRKQVLPKNPHQSNILTLGSLVPFVLIGGILYSK